MKNIQFRGKAYNLSKVLAKGILFDTLDLLQDVLQVVFCDY